MGAGPRRALFTVISPGLSGAAASRRDGNPLGCPPEAGGLEEEEEEDVGKADTCESSVCGSQSQERGTSAGKSLTSPSCAVTGGNGQGRAGRGKVHHASTRGCFLPQTFETGSRGPVVLSISLCPLRTVGGEGEREVIAVTRRGVAGGAAGGKSALQGQPVHSELVGVDQPPVPRGAQRGPSYRSALWAHSEQIQDPRTRGEQVSATKRGPRPHRLLRPGQ